MKKINKKAFTLIELLAVIIILAVIALIAIPMVLDVVENTKEQSRIQSVNGLIDATRLYTNEAVLDKSLSTEGNLYDSIKERVQGKAPDTGEIYVNENNQVAVAVKLDKYCYVKKYNGEITKTEQEKCFIYPPTDESCFEYRQLVDYTINYNVCMQVLSVYQINGKIYSEEDRNLICTGGIASDGGSIEGAIDLGLFDVNSLVGLNAITNVEYKDEAAITGYNCYVGNTEGQEEISDVVIPSKLDDLAVKRIGVNAFYKKSLTSVYFLGEVEEIGNSAFYDNQISDLDISNLKNLKVIEEYAFGENSLSGTLDLSKLTSLTVVNGFNDNQLNNIVLPKGTKIIEEGAFGWNQLSGTLDLSYLPNLTSVSGFYFNQLTKVILPKSVTVIGSSAFSNNQLTEIKLSSLVNLETIGNNAFDGNQLSELALASNKLTSIGNFAFYSNNLSKIDLSNLTSLETIGNNTFASNDLSKIKLSGLTNLEIIGSHAFYNNGASGIVDLSASSNLTTIGDHAFDENQLDEIKLSGLPNLEAIEDYAFYNNGASGVIDLSTSTKLKTIGYEAFSYNQFNVNIRNLVNLETVDYAAFSSSAKSGIVDLSGSSKLTTIESFSFSNNKLDEIKLSGMTNLETIGYGAFKGCEASGVIDLSASSKLRTIGNSAFYNNKISKVNLSNLKNLEVIEDYAFENNDISELNLSGLTNLTTIEPNTFSKNQISGTLDLSSLTSLTKLAGFYGNHITKLILPPNLISVSGFSNNRLSEIIFPSSLETIEGSAFQANQLTNIDLSNLANLKTIGDYAFYLNQISELVLASDKLTSIGNHAFYENQLSEIDLSNLTSLETIGNLAFSGNKLIEVKLPTSIINIGNSAISTSPGIYSGSIIILPDGTKKDIYYYNNSNLNKIVNPTGRTFDWNNIILGNEGEAFETGTVTKSNGTVTITKE